MASTAPWVPILVVLIGTSVYYTGIHYFEPYGEVSISTNYGDLKGYISKTRDGREYSGFKGIPYAQPPVGKLRFQVGICQTRDDICWIWANIENMKIWYLYFNSPRLLTGNGKASEMLLKILLCVLNWILCLKNWMARKTVFFLMFIRRERYVRCLTVIKIKDSILRTLTCRIVIPNNS